MYRKVERTTRWLARCKDEMARLNALPDTVNREQLLFGINQGAVYEDIRIEHAKEISKMNLDGYAVGVWQLARAMRKCTGFCSRSALAGDKPTLPYGRRHRQTSGSGRPGVDFFDCVYPSGMDATAMYTRTMAN